MKVGSVGETVEVKAEATQVETINPTIGGTVTGPPIQKWNQFGATFGGPIDIPGVIHGKDRFFFFFAYQGQRQKSVAMLLKVRYRVL